MAATRAADPSIPSGSGGWIESRNRNFLIFGHVR
jgi:hypothetical protein